MSIKDRLQYLNKKLETITDPSQQVELITDQMSLILYDDISDLASSEHNLKLEVEKLKKENFLLKRMFAEAWEEGVLAVYNSTVLRKSEEEI